MNIGQKVTLLKENLGFKNWQEFGKFVDLNGDWLIDLSKKVELQTVDVQRLIKISDKCNVSLDYLLRDNEVIGVSTVGGLPDNDVCQMLDQIKIEIDKDNSKFNGNKLDDKNRKLLSDSVIIIKNLINSNI